MTREHEVGGGHPSVEGEDINNCITSLIDLANGVNHSLHTHTRTHAHTRTHTHTHAHTRRQNPWIDGSQRASSRSRKRLRRLLSPCRGVKMWL